MVVEIMTKSLRKLKYVKFTIALGINLDDSSKPKKGYTQIAKSTLPLKQKNIITHGVNSTCSYYTLVFTMKPYCQELKQQLYCCMGYTLK